MAIIAGRGVAGGAGGVVIQSGANTKDVSNKEDLASFISMITRDETPFMSSIGKTKATNIYHEWQTDELNSPGDSRIGEGTDYAVPNAPGLPGAPGDGGDPAFTPGGNLAGNDYAVTGTDRTRVGNYTQINGKSIAISGTRRVIDQAGVADEYAYQLKKRGTEMRRDIENDLINTYQVANGSGRRTMGGYQAWINNPKTVELNGATVGGVAESALTDATTGNGRTAVETVAGSKVSLSLSDIDGTMQKIYEEGGKAGKIMLSPKLRRDFSDLMVTDSGVRRNIDMDGKLRQSVDVYMSDFGDLMVMPNYIMGLGGVNKDSSALIYDSMWFAIATLRPLQEVDVGQRGDSTIGMMIEECTFEVKNPIGCGAIYNLK